MTTNHTALLFTVLLSSLVSLGCEGGDPGDPNTAKNTCGSNSDPNIASNCMTPETDTDTGTETGTSTVTATDTGPTTTATQTSTVTTTIPSWCNENVTSAEAGDRINYPGMLTATCNGVVWKLAVRAPSGTTATTAQATVPGSTQTITFAGQMGKNCTYLTASNAVGTNPVPPVIRGTGFNNEARANDGLLLSFSIFSDTCTLTWARQE